MGVVGLTKLDQEQRSRCSTGKQTFDFHNSRKKEGRCAGFLLYCISSFLAMDCSMMATKDTSSTLCILSPLGLTINFETTFSFVDNNFDP